MDIAKTYVPSDVEDKIFQFWQDHGYFHSDPAPDTDPYCIVIPPPNVTGVLHMGHALNNTIQDILVRKARMDGKTVKWVVGTDHAGIATQNVVERKLKKENLTRQDLGREKFLQEVWKWKEDHGSTIIDQLKKMGCSCDYSQERFTMDPGLAKAVRECFVRLYEKGLIYQGERMIHWCSKDHTALSDEEAEHNDHSGKLWTIRYKIKGEDSFLQVATTRPETLLGDTAVAVNPEDERYKGLIGKLAIVPFVNREIPIIADSYVDASFGTGMVKITPSHDPNDYEMGLRHELPKVEVMDESGIMNKNAGPYVGMDRFSCRKKIIEDLSTEGLLADTKDHPMSIRKCYRCDTVVEPRVSKQWFVKMKPMADEALKHFNSGSPKFYPERYGNIYLRWLEGIKDWCISRQIWWGHQIPVWYCDDCQKMTVKVDTPSCCDHCSSKNLRQDTDVLDTWFSSWLWPFSTMNWPEGSDELNFFFPTDTLVTAQEIIFFWVARMVMASLEFTEKVPFKDVYIHGTVRDETGLKMSKSFGNVIDPLHIIRNYGADALRHSLMMVASRGNDIYISDKKFEIGRNFATKIWNASRFLLMNMEGETVNHKGWSKFQNSFTNDDKYILHCLESMKKQVSEAIDDYRFNDAALSLYDFFWKHFCDRYIEEVKASLREEGESKQRSLAVLFYCLCEFLKSVHPVMPFISEELWQILRNIDSGLGSCIAIEKNVQGLSVEVDNNAISLTEKKYDFVKGARNLRKIFNVPPKVKVTFHLNTKKEYLSFLSEEKESMIRSIRAESLEISDDFKPSSPMPSEVTELGTLFMVLDADWIDFASECQRYEKKKTEIEKGLIALEKKLGNENFIKRAQPEVVSREKERRQVLAEELEKVLSIYEFFKQK